jgi:hypothetical protein
MKMNTTKIFKILLVLGLFLICLTVVASGKLTIIGYGIPSGSSSDDNLRNLALNEGGNYVNAENTSTAQVVTTAIQSAISTQIPVIPPTVIPQPGNCDCDTYNPYTDETANCALYGIDCSPCLETCCDCKNYDPLTESVDCLSYGIDCSPCASVCFDCDCDTYNSYSEPANCFITGEGCSSCYYLCSY